MESLTNSWKCFSFCLNVPFKVESGHQRLRRIAREKKKKMNEANSDKAFKDGALLKKETVWRLIIIQFHVCATKPIEISCFFKRKVTHRPTMSCNKLSVSRDLIDGVVLFVYPSFIDDTNEITVSQSIYKFQSMLNTISCVIENTFTT